MKKLPLLALPLIIHSCSPTPKQTAESPAAFWPIHTIDSTLYGADGVRTMDFNGDALPDLISGGEEYGATRVYLNRGDQQFEVMEFPSPQVEDALAVDIDQNGQMEILTFSEGSTQEITLHYAGADGNWISASVPASKGIQWMYGAAVQIIPDGPMEVIVGAKGNNAVIGWLKTGTDLNLVNEWTLHPIAAVGWIMSIEWLDIDGDGRRDVLVSDRTGPNAAVKWYRNPGPDRLEGAWTEHLVGLRNKEPMFLDVADLNGDGRLDIIAADIAEGVFYFEKEENNAGFRPDSLLFAYPEWAGTRGKSVACIDIDRDGDLEIVTSYEGAKERHGLIYSKLNTQSGQWEHFPISDKPGIKYDKILPLDIDADGDLDLFTTEERENGNGLGVIWYEHQER